MVTTYGISGMHCQKCIEKISAAFKSEGFLKADVTLEPPQVVISSEKKLELSEVQAILAKAGEYTVQKSNLSQPKTIDTTGPESLKPLFVIVAYIVLGTLITSYVTTDYSFHYLMRNFMGVFFLVFSLFKMLDVKKFAEAYSTYDLLASRSHWYSLSYPFIELLLGIAYLVNVFPIITNVTTFILMSIGTIGVGIALSKKRTIQCACLGTSLKLPMTKITLLEDLTMAVMALSGLIMPL